MKKKRVMGLLLTVVMAASLLLSACGNSGGGEAGSTSGETSGSGSTEEGAGEEDSGGEAAAGDLDLSEEVELTMYVISDRPAGQDEVDAYINEVLKEKLNCTLKINWIAWADYANKYPLLFSSGEEFDIAYSATWLNFASLAQKGAFLNLDELWPTYAPDNFAMHSDAAKQQSLIDGHYYCVPTLYATYAAYGPIYRMDLMEGTDWNGQMETFEDIEAYCDIVKELYPEMEPLDIYSAGSEFDDVYLYAHGYMPSKGSTNDFLFFDPAEENPELFTYYEAEEIPDFLDMMARWNEKGFFTKSALSDTDSTKTQNGKAALRMHNIDTYVSYHIQQPDWGFTYTNFASDIRHMPFTQDVMVISNTSPNPERAMAFWNLVTTDQDLYDAFYYGILDKTYALDENGNFEILDMDTYAASAMWAARTTELNRNQIGTPEDYDAQIAEFEAAIVEGEGGEKYLGFAIDTTSIETEYAACQSVHQQYWWPLELGYTDAVSGLAEYQEKMEAAGIARVREELQKQLDEYVAGLN